MIENEYLLKLFRENPLPILLLLPDAPDFTIEDVNKSFLDLRGLKESDLVGKSIFETFPLNMEEKDSEFNSHLINSLKEVLLSRSVQKLDLQIYDIPISGNNHNFKNWHLENVPLLNSDNEVAYIVVTVKDVTATISQQKRQPHLEAGALLNQAFLQSRNEFIETVLQSLPIGIAVNKIDDRTATLVNKRFSEIYGWSEAEMTDVESFFKKVYPDEAYRKKITEQVMADIQSNDPERMNWNGIHILTSTGKKRIINAKNIPLFDQNLMISTVIDITQSAKQVEEIDRIKANQEALINGIEGLVWSVDSRLCIISANIPFLEKTKLITGEMPKEGDPALSKKLGEEINKKWKAYYQKAFKGQKYTVTDEAFNPIKQRMEYSLVSFTPTYGDDGQLLGVVCFSKDITDEILNQATLKMIWSELNKIMDYSPDVICTIDEFGRFINVSAASEKIWGYKPEELIGSDYINMLEKEDIEKFGQVLGDVKGGVATVNFENRYVRKDGRLVPLVWSARWDNEERILYCIARDATEKINNKTALIESEKKYKYLFENNPSPMFIWDFATLQIVDCNEEALLKYGYTRDEFLTLSIRDIRPEEDIPLLNEFTKDEAMYSKIHKNVWRHKKKSGEIIFVEVSGHLIDYNGRKVSLVQLNDVTEKLISERELKENEAKLLSAQKIAKLGYWQLLPDQVGLYWSEEVYNIWGVNKETFKLSLDSFHKTIHPDDIEAFDKEIDSVFTTDREHDFEHRIILPDGSVKWVHEKGKLIKDDDGKIILFEGTVQDITVGRIAHDKLLLSEARYKGLVDSQTNYVIRTNVEGKYTYGNEKFIKDFSWIYSDNNIIGKDSLISINDYHHQRVFEIAEKCLTQPNTVFQVELDKPKKGGGNITTLWEFICLTDSKGKPSEIQCVGIDISDRKKAEDALKNSNTRYEYATKATSDAIWDWDLITNTIQWGEGYYTIFGYDTKNLSIEINSWTYKLHPEDRDRVLKDINVIIEGSESKWVSEYRYRKADETFAFVVDRGFVVRNEEGKAIRMVGAMQDITQRKEEEFNKEIIAEVSLLFNNNMPLHETLQLVLEKLLSNENFSMAEAWLIGSEQDKINLVAKLSDRDETKEFYKESSKITSFVKGEGLPGITWQSRSLQMWQNLARNKKFVRMNAAIKSDLKTVYGLPLIFNDEMIGVLVLGLVREEQLSQSFITLFENIGLLLSSEIKRKQLEQQLNQIFDFAPDVICIVGGNGYFKKINHSSFELLGYTEEELLASPISEFIHPDDKQNTAFEVQSVNEQKSTSFFENRFVTKSGMIKWLAWTYAPSPEQGVIFAVAKDITEKKNLEVLLNKSNKLAAIGSWEIDVIKGSVFWSDITKEIREADPDFEPDLATGMHYFKEGAARETISKRVKECIENGTSWDDELEIVTQKGNLKWIRTIGEGEFINGKCIKVYGSFQDINEKKYAELEILKLYEEKNTILESIGDAFFAVDEKWVVTYWNKLAEKMLLTPTEKILGHNLWKVFAESIDSISYKKYHEAFETKQVVHFEDFYLTLGKWFEISAYPSSSGLSVYFKDITYRKNYEEQLIILNEQLQNRAKELSVSNAELEQFAYVASHDLQEPLRMIMGFLSQIEKKYGNIIDDKGRQYIHFAVDGAKRMRQIILDLLEFSRIGSTEDKQEEVDLNELMNEIIALYRKQIEEKKAVVQFGKLPILKASKTPLRQVFQNLLSNSLKYHTTTHESVPEIVISAKSTKKHWLFSVKDNGIGIDPQYFNKIFIIFQRLHSKEEFSGTGMGLAVTKKIIESMGGKIWVESEEGKGSIFYFTVNKNNNIV